MDKFHSTLPPRPYDWMNHGPGDYEALKQWRRTYNRINKVAPKETPINPRTIWLSGVLFVMGVLALVLISTVSPAGTLTGIVGARDLISIGKVLAQPNTYHLQIIRMHGVVRQVEILKPHDPYQPGDPCYGAYRFQLEDESGSIEVGVLGDRLHCGTPARAAAPEVAEGDRVIVQGRIHAPGEYVDKMTAPFPVRHSTTYVVAIQLSHPEP